MRHSAILVFANKQDLVSGQYSPLLSQWSHVDCKAGPCVDGACSLLELISLSSCQTRATVCCVYVWLLIWNSISVRAEERSEHGGRL
jgi:hypothetical protein